MRASRSFGACLAAVVVAAGSLLATAGPAHALTLDQTCVGTWAVTYNPPITNTPQLVAGTLTGVFLNCTNPLALSGTHVQAFTDTVSCTTLLNAGSATRTLLWNGIPPAAPSVFSYNWTATDIGGQVLVTNAGSITSGTFASDTAIQTATLVTPDALQCAGAGVASVTGPTTLTVYRP